MTGPVLLDFSRIDRKRGHSTTLRSALGIVMFPSLLSNGGRSQPVEWAA